MKFSIARALLFLFVEYSSFAGGYQSSALSKGVLIIGGGNILCFLKVQNICTDKDLFHSWAGPAGVSTALVLQNLGLKNITIIEKRSDVIFESEKAYLYYLDGRGQRLTNLLNITHDIAASALSSFDYNNLTEFLPSGVKKTMKLPSLVSKTEKYWLPRSTFLATFLSRIKQANEKNPDNPIDILFNTSCDSINSDKEGNLCVRIITSDKETSTNSDRLLQPSLLVGCDGLDSKVRRWLESNVGNDFSLQSYPSDSAGLRFKMLSLKPRFLLYTDESRTTKAPTPPGVAFAIRSAFKDSFRRISLGLLAVRGEREADIIQSISNGKSLSMLKLL